MSKYVGIKFVTAQPEGQSPKDIFKEYDYAIDRLPFGLALEACRTGSKIARKGWNSEGLYIYWKQANHKEDDSSKLMMTAIDRSPTKWDISDKDVMACDWEIVEYL